MALGKFCNLSEPQLFVRRDNGSSGNIIVVVVIVSKDCGKICGKCKCNDILLLNLAWSVVLILVSENAKQNLKAHKNQLGRTESDQASEKAPDVSHYFSLFLVNGEEPV